MFEINPIVYIVDNDTSAQSPLQELIRAAGWHPAVFASAEEFLAYPAKVRPSCLILEVMLPGLNGFALQQRLAAARADIPVIFITAQSDIPMSVRAMKAGAIEFFSKPFDARELLEAIRIALDRSRALQATVAEMALLQARYARLSGRERGVMALVVAGLMNKQVADELGISEDTVKTHRGRVMRKMQASSLAELVVLDTKLRAPAGDLQDMVGSLPPSCARVAPCKTHSAG